MDNYFGRCDINLLGYIVNKLITYGIPSALYNLSFLDKSIPKILDDDPMYLRVLNPEMQYNYERYLNPKRNQWDDKYLLYKTLKRLIPFLDICVNMLTQKLASSDSRLFINNERYRLVEYGGILSTIMSIDFLDIPGIDYQEIKRMTMMSMDTSTNEDHRCQLIIDEIKDGKFRVSFELFINEDANNKLIYETLLDEPQLRILLGSVLYSGRRIGNNMGKEILV